MMQMVGYKNYISNCIRGLQAKFRWDPSNRLEIPFDVTKAYAISTMLGSNDLCATVKKFLIDNSDHQGSNDLMNIRFRLRLLIFIIRN
jgi:hypothetical protein